MFPILENATLRRYLPLESVSLDDLHIIPDPAIIDISSAIHRNADYQG